jgi:hypothetical protein
MMLALLLLGNVLANPTVTSWRNPECEREECALKGVKYYLKKTLDQRNGVAGNSVAAEIETTQKTQLRDFAFVQYIRGCHFRTNASGAVVMGTRDILGEPGQSFKHVNWEIDSGFDADPIYWSYAQAGRDPFRGFEVPRNASYVTANPMLTDKYDWWAGKVGNVGTPKIYISDDPTPTSLGFEGLDLVGNVSSLEFRLCVHRVADLPRTVEQRDAVMPNPLHCFEWSSNYEVNFQQGLLEERRELHPACRD